MKELLWIPLLMAVFFLGCLVMKKIDSFIEKGPWPEDPRDQEPSPGTDMEAKPPKAEKSEIHMDRTAVL